MLQIPRTSGLVVAVLVALVCLGVSTYLQPAAKTSLAVQIVLYFFATLTVFQQFDLFRRPMGTHTS